MSLPDQPQTHPHYPHNAQTPALSLQVGGGSDGGLGPIACFGFSLPVEEREDAQFGPSPQLKSKAQHLPTTTPSSPQATAACCAFTTKLDAGWWQRPQGVRSPVPFRPRPPPRPPSKTSSSRPAPRGYVDGGGTGGREGVEGWRGRRVEREREGGRGTEGMASGTTLSALTHARGEAVV